MDPIKGMNQVTRILRRKLSERASSTTKPGASPSMAAPTAEKSSKPGADEIKRKIGERIQTLSDDDRKGTKAAQIFVESVLIWEFGNQLSQDPQFADLSREVVKEMADRPDVWRKMTALLDEIGKYAKPGVSSQ